MKRQSMLPTLNRTEFMILPESVGWYTEMPDHEVSRKAGVLNNFSIHIVLGGRGCVEHDRSVYTLQRGDAFLYFPLTEQRYYSSQDDPWEVRWVHFYGSGLREYLIERGFSRSPLWKLRQTKPVEDALDALLVEAEARGFLGLTRLSTLTYAVLAEFVSEAAPWSDPRSAEPGSRVLDLLPAMRAEACLPFDLQEWADRAGVSTYYFCRLFKKATSMTPMTFITLSRLQKGKQLLLEQPDLTVKDIAEQTGYPSVSYFNKRFLEQEGMTPTDYRQLYRKE
ncbi:helix-turn-helix domain-containing protein [Paenibacillus mucilaginosus]|uniref:AraC family transcriptional regulator n=3 Tax=Paenibacillus mucilaginosus TaxID=61624 RepID=H6NFJ5_9BACL|nr:AraC family transcriptional regulator [Paenibacillus mucilaginosus]AEI41547.1 transcriptional regulator, AraC family [Paenibacillus mucilaginosus KNP414]AFC30081.1 AraC family transcriptional regulator [Paenibacillus mucilaginosus 3016]AGN70690.1 AraC family transcriptional regulator [Paenibacillus mucilaginosus K02]MCG7215417.1 AraC family transcriptional regulator [Paenibacillus mucilaginosus]WDM30551.1 helix-turn-helix domain-containing protein [Paenibacillus mucilaginosus]